MRFLKLIVVLLVLIPSIQFIAAAGDNKSDELPDVFSHQDITIEANRHIERLLIASANAVVAGTVKEGIIVVDGSLTVLPGAKIGGKIIILGGKLNNETAVEAARDAWVISPGQVPFTGIVLGGLMLLFTVGIVVMPYFLWLILQRMGRYSIFTRFKDRFLEIQHRWPVLYIVITLATSALMLIVFSVLAWQTIFRSATGMFDNAFIWMIRYFASPELDKAMITITNIGFGFTFGVLVLATIAILAVFRHWVELKGLIICLLGGALLNQLLKHLFERARPESFQIVAASGFSFPSGHAMVSLCFYGMVAFIIIRKRTWHWRIAGTVITALLMIAIGVSRIYLGVHYPSDVVAGYAAGATWLGFSVSLVMWWERKRIRESTPSPNKH